MVAMTEPGTPASGDPVESAHPGPAADAGTDADGTARPARAIELDEAAAGPREDESATAVRATTPRRAAATRRRRGPGVLTVLGILLICLGLAGFGWIGYQYYGTNAPAEKAASEESSQLRNQWKAEPGSTSGASASPASPVPAPPSAGSAGVPADQPAKVSLDSAMAILRIPRFGATYEKPILVGTSDYALGRGVAWYETTARPGQIGNFALAGHRVTHGEPFARLLELQVGDEVIVETRDYIYTYKVDTPPAKLTVKDVDTWVIDPVPGKKDVKPTQAIITLTTCQDLFHSPDRAVGFGHLVTTVKK